jgi:hypothetical protein
MALEGAAPGWQARTRLELARGHWSLGEHGEALACLERLADADPHVEGLAALIEELRSDAVAVPDDVSQRLRGLEQRVHPARPIAPPSGSPLVTGTLASLLVDQGHAAEALAIAEDVLRERPGDARALAVRERVRGPERGACSDPSRGAIERLEKWLAAIQRLKRGEARA